MAPPLLPLINYTNNEQRQQQVLCVALVKSEDLGVESQAFTALIREAWAICPTGQSD